MRRVLEINFKPQLTSYVHHSYTNAIVDKSFISSFFVSDLKTERWRMRETDIVYTCDKELSMVSLYENKGRMSPFFEMRRRCSENDEVIVKLEDMKLMDSMSYIRVGISRESEINNSQAPGYWFYWNQYDITTQKGHISYENHVNLYYKLTRKQNDIQISVSKNMKKWDVIHESDYELSMSEELDFYIQVYFGENQYEQWINMNYIQLFYDETDPNTVYLDYYMFPRKGDDASYQYLCHFIDTEYINYERYKEVKKGSIHKYIKHSILQGYYVNVCLDEYFISNRKAYNSYNYEHYNLVYGFDDGKRLYYILGYNGDGKPEISTISYSTLKKAASDNDIVRYRYNVNKWNFNFQLSHVKEMLIEYINGEDSSRRFVGVLGNRKGVYGLKIFDQLYGTEVGRKMIIDDRRISFVLYEHCKLMQGRLTFLEKRGYLKQEVYEELLNKCELMVKTSEVLKNLVIKNSLRPQYKENILLSLADLKRCELDFLECLLCNLTC